MASLVSYSTFEVKGRPYEIRAFEPRDLTDVQRIFTAGMNVTKTGCIDVLRCRIARTAYAVVLLAFLFATRPIFFVMLGLLVIFVLTCWFLFYVEVWSYIRHALAQDVCVSGIQKTYFDTGGYFWVAVDKTYNEVVGCIALQGLETGPKNRQQQQSNGNSSNNNNTKTSMLECGTIETETAVPADKWTRAERVGELRRLSVDPEHRRWGIGRHLLAHLENFARQQGYSHIMLTCSNYQANARKLYTGNGFAKTDEMERFSFPIEYNVFKFVKKL